MSPWIGNLIFIMSVTASIVIRIPYDQVSQKTKVIESRKDMREKIFLLFIMLGMVLLPLLSFTHLLSFAAYAPSPIAVFAGALAMGASLWVFYRSHKDLGRNWSASLEIREDHELVTTGIYKSLRHPMYASIFLLGIGQLLLIANWIAGPGLLLAFSPMFLSRLWTEERMMFEKFGDQYEHYRRQTKRLIHGVW